MKHLDHQKIVDLARQAWILLLAQDDGKVGGVTRPPLLVELGNLVPGDFVGVYMP